MFGYLAFGQQVGLIETGAAGGEQNIVDTLAALGRPPAGISLVMNIHEHPDHIAGNTFFQM